uniref:Immunoglobulin V-set domain-containing protein n=1 Tax=Salarias fasciatus TaxID=181472 RepID=A0A672H972_SALFA
MDFIISVKFDPSHPKIVPKTETVEFKCKHDDSDLPVMLWYQQTQTVGLNLIGYAEKLQLSSTAVYFCAASQHSATFPCSSIQKPA